MSSTSLRHGVQFCGSDARYCFRGKDPGRFRYSSFPLFLCGVLIGALLFLGIPESALAAEQAAPSSLSRASFPSSYGAVVFRHKGESPAHLYIIGTSHRHTVSRTNGSNTAKVQAEVYKIGEWLIENEAVQLLLPEGLFKRRPEPPDPDEEMVLIDSSFDEKERNPFPFQFIEERLSDTSVYLNAEMLLKEHFRICTRQIEDRELYEAVGECLNRLEGAGDDIVEATLLHEELCYLQEKRTAVMLQKIPEIVEEEIRRGRVTVRKAIFTIGLSHIADIIRYLGEEEIRIHAPLFSRVGTDDYNEAVHLIRKQYGVTIIVPRTLADDPDVLRSNRIDPVTVMPQGTPPPVETVALP